MIILRMHQQPSTDPRTKKGERQRNRYNCSKRWVTNRRGEKKNRHEGPYRDFYKSYNCIRNQMLFFIRNWLFGLFLPMCSSSSPCLLSSHSETHLRFYLPLSFLPPVLFPFTRLPLETKPRNIHDIGVIPQHLLHRQTQVSSSKLTVNNSSLKQIVSPP